MGIAHIFLNCERWATGGFILLALKLNATMRSHTLPYLTRLIPLKDLPNMPGKVVSVTGSRYIKFYSVG